MWNLVERLTAKDREVTSGFGKMEVSDDVDKSHFSGWTQTYGSEVRLPP